MRCLAIVAILIMSSASGVLAAPAAVFTLYSDVCYNREGGDLLGTRIGILTLPDARYVYLQSAEGVFTPPQLIKLEPNDLKDGQLTFSAQMLTKGPQSIFRGRVTTTALTGAFDKTVYSGKKRLNLHRITDRKAVPNC